MTALTRELTAIVSDAFAAEGLSAEFGTVKRSDRPDLAQFQCNGALPAAKQAKTNPRALATKVADRLKQNPIFAKVEIAGPGFINLDLTDEALAARVAAVSKDDRLGAPETGTGKTMVIDYGGPNVAKPMHVGHLRSAIIGDSLKRLFRANGWKVIGDVHLGDWGLQMGQLISEVELRGMAPIYFDANFTGPYPDESPVTMDDLEVLYPAASAACKADPARLELARKATAELQAGRPGYMALWKHFFAVSEKGLKREYGSLGIEFDLWNGEASVDPLIPPMIDDLKARGIAEESEGALVIQISEPDDKKEMPPLILLKSDGAALYGTTDLATIVDRVKSFDPDFILYVVDQRQHGHFEQVFRGARKSGLAGKAELEHAGFGTMNGPDGKPFKTRAGGVMKLFDLIAMTTDAAKARIAEAGLGADYPVEEQEDIAQKVGIAALKFADLSNWRLTDYIFDLDRFTKFEGKTGPYLQYAAVRIRSILRKAEEQGFVTAPPVVRSAVERALVLKILALPEAMESAEEKRAPNFLCEYVFELAQEFSRFYAEHHILSEPDADLRAARLGLCALTLAVLTKALDLLGIEVPTRM
ncbi:arginine--tRNA ligase [Rhizomicrobium electricum]|uniref:Arginine--tRNA ligase n=1 Tax=Rhizomicrobium electricum TaxID=480070 RepID=A0ABN1E5V7_9PROT|nr:arginine--tRNA ligase [Rhizomicrobium electricum]NIJ47686.1 arginyl-tRNA synthetase [Rhizomicrobium electricum]